MTDSQAKQIQTIQGFLAERKKYEQWIAQLEERAENTPPHVYIKVHADYSRRLDEAQARLVAEAGVVQKLVTDLDESLATQDAQVGEKRDERAEAELRAAVGEYGEKEWDKLRGKLDATITELTTERDALQRERDTLGALLAEATAPAAAEPAPAPPPVAVQEEPVAPPPVAAKEPVPPRPSKSVEAPPPPPPPRVTAAATRVAEPELAFAPEKKADVDELAFLRSVLGRTTPYSASPAQAAAPAPESAAPAPVAPPAPPRTSGRATQEREKKAAPPEPPPIPAPVIARSSTNAEPRASGGFGAPTPRTSEAVRSLKCQECGTLNYPTEWYCERCGGELAAF